MKPTFYKVEIKPKKKERCRICNTNLRPTINILANGDLKTAVQQCLDVSLEETNNGLSKRICVTCMQFTNFMAEFRQICSRTQVDLLQTNDPSAVMDRSCQVTELLTRVKTIEVKPLDEPKVRIIKQEIICPPKREPSDVMVEEYLDEIVQDEVIECTYQNCGRRFRSQAYLTKHVKDIHRKVRNEFRCNMCGASYKAIFQLTQHQRAVHRNNNMEKCGYCAQMISSDKINMHIAECGKVNIHALMSEPSPKVAKLSKEDVERKLQEDDRLYMCGICMERFKTIKEYTGHWYIHSQPTDETEIVQQD